MDAAAELGRNPVSKHQIQPEYGDEQADAGRDCRTRLARPNSQARTRTGKYIFFPVQLTTCRAGNLTCLIHTLFICVTIHTYTHTTQHVSSYQFLLFIPYNGYNCSLHIINDIVLYNKHCYIIISSIIFIILAQNVQCNGTRRLEDAMNRALSASDLPLVMWLCGRLDPATTPAALPQHILVCLLQQLSASNLLDDTVSSKCQHMQYLVFSWRVILRRPHEISPILVEFFLQQRSIINGAKL